jgi:glutathione S-transferase
LKLVIGDKNWSSWSLRPWLVLKEAAIPFAEIHVGLRRPDTKAQVSAHSASGKIPVLLTPEGPVWDSLAIGEYLADRYPEKKLLPAGPYARAVARSVIAEMHAGFQALRNEMSMECIAVIEKPDVSADTLKDIARIQAIWQECRQKFGGQFGQGGEFLFGHFTLADAMYAPVVSRFMTYGVALDDVSARYAKAVMAMDAMQEWIAGARLEEKRKAAP